MGDDLRHRLGGFGLLLLAAVTLWLFVVTPLQQANQGQHSIQTYYIPLLGIGLFVPIGLFLLIAGCRIPYRDPETRKLRPVGWLLVLTGLASTGALWWWVEQQFAALGYR